MRFKFVTLETYDSKIVGFYLKQIDILTTNFVSITPTYSTWLKNGKLEKNEYELTPESLRILIYALENSKYIDKFNLGPSREFIKLYPTTADLKARDERISKLPIR